MTADWKAAALLELPSVDWASSVDREEFLAKLPSRLTQEFAILCAERALLAFEPARQALECAKALLRGEKSVADCKLAIGAAQTAPCKVAAMAVYFAGVAAIAAENAYLPASSAASAAWTACGTTSDALDWQVSALADLIANWEDSA